MLLFGLKNCDTCRKAIKALPDAEFRDVRADGVPKETLQAAHEALGADLVNTRSATWRGLDDAARALPAVDLIMANPAVMKRPLIVVDNQYFLGWTKAVEADVRALL